LAWQWPPLAAALPTQRKQVLLLLRTPCASNAVWQINDWELGNSVQNNAMLEESGQLCTCSGHKIQVKADT
jgi:hypothetical protein